MTTKSFTQHPTLTLVLRMKGPERPRDRVSPDALLQHVVGELEGAEYWPEPDHGPDNWDPQEGYEIDSATWADGRLDVVTEEPQEGVRLLAGGLVWRRQRVIKSRVSGWMWKPESELAVLASVLYTFDELTKLGPVFSINF